MDGVTVAIGDGDGSMAAQACDLALEIANAGLAGVAGDDVFDRLTPKSRLVVLCSPSNPTGAVTPREDLMALVGGLERRGVTWLSDEIYSDYSYGKSFVSASATSVLRSLRWMIGGRAGAMTPPSVIFTMMGASS